ncbi:MAG: C25 family cysteine peptidase, partial [Anaerolineales bacterium]
SSLGYVANVWKEASAAVYTTIGDPRDLLTCPPVDASWFPVKELAPSHISYFNLHGIEDGSEWYGQRSANDFGSTPEYPVALRPADVLNSGRAPVIVFSEACYGANILGKKIGEALCLRFLECGTRALVGSTKIAYGSVTTPLIGADLLGRLFWQNANAGLPVGEALRRAKLQMAQEMHDRQGFLDGEDQKTLISFVLYGDPLATMPGVRSTKEAKRLPAPRFVEPPATVCDKANGDRAVSPEVVAQIKTVVARYLPGMNDAEWRVAHAHARCTAQHACPTAHLAVRAKYASSLHHDPHTTVVTLSKTLRADARTHPHYARITLDEKGAIIKLAVSR